MRRLLLPLALLATPANAEAPRIATDIAPIHSIVSAITQGVSDPALLMPPGTDPHDYALRPSAARALQEADIFIWVGPLLSPWLEDPADTLAPNATRMTLMDLSPNTLPYRSEYGDHDEHEDEHHDDHEGGHDDDEHDDHKEDAHTDTHGHDHSGQDDPHVWLDPQNLAAWSDLITDALAEADPDNAEAYKRNEIAYLEALEAGISAGRAARSADGIAHVVAYHDALQYMEATFSVETIGTIIPADGASPGPAHLAELAEEIAEEGITCVLAEPGYDPRLIEAAFAGKPFKVAEIDQLASDLPALFETTGETLANCLSQ